MSNDQNNELGREVTCII